MSALCNKQTLLNLLIEIVNLDVTEEKFSLRTVYVCMNIIM